MTKEKVRVFSAEEKTRVVLEVLKEDIWWSRLSRCLVPGCNVVYYKELPSREELWDKYYTAVPKRQRQYVSQSKIVKRA
ncbi:hypothetical protein [Candidatus Tisiphia endosymbiont of Oplodontha viridula]|uniref:hypothetical protein n=1 Tax=Candidatus Tisiphia endosymbiont of Oplodontha viridula TaxID=3077925 RepID=UPI0035C90597